MNTDYTIELNEAALDNGDKFVIKTYYQEDVSTHNHNFFELVYVIGGSTLHTLNGISGSLGLGDYFIVDYGSEHCYAQSKDLTLINCLFLPEIIDDTLKGCRSFEALLHVCLLRYYKLYFGKTSANRIFHDDDGRILQLLTGMMKEYEEKKVGYAEVFRSRLLEILILTMRNVVDSNLSRIKNDTILEAIGYINSNYPIQTLLSKFCEEYHYSPQYISRKFKQETGFTISEYLQKVRIEKSCELLAGSDMPISDIAESVGYADLKFFNNLFKRMIKMSPREYRKVSS
ncbi:MAG TPA: helix-turn-helix transcriptional regulator [Clostridiales bacterium]|nr:helix-turn-helix transcriptional regulator [Clostridiales bacterium]